MNELSHFVISPAPGKMMIKDEGGGDDDPCLMLV